MGLVALSLPAGRLRAGRPVVSLNGAKVGGWTFDANNVLAFEHQAGYSAWLQFTHLLGGPLFMGTFAPSAAEEDSDAAASEFHVRPAIGCSEPRVTLHGAPDCAWMGALDLPVCGWQWVCVASDGCQVHLQMCPLRPPL